LISNKDYSEYLFNGELYRKGRLVLAVCKKYVEDNALITFKELKKIFPDSLQARSKIQFSNIQVVFSKVDEISPTEMKRFFTDTDELIGINDCIIAVSREWNKENIQWFIQTTKSLGYNIQPSVEIE